MVVGFPAGESAVRQAARSWREFRGFAATDGMMWIP
jgi:hypothetical protein